MQWLDRSPRGLLRGWQCPVPHPGAGYLDGSSHEVVRPHICNLYIFMCYLDEGTKYVLSHI